MRTIVLTVGLLMLSLSSQGAIINVPGDSAAIQGAIDGANPGDTILVAAGSYPEDIVINKSLHLQGEGANKTHIIGTGSGDVVFVHADHVVIIGISISNGGTQYWDDYDPHAALELLGSDSCRIERCGFHDNPAVGLALTGSSYNTISLCDLSSNKIGLYFYENQDSVPHIDNVKNVITHNRFTDNIQDAIRFTHTLESKHVQNILQYNYFARNHGRGFWLIMSHQNQVRMNSFINNRGFGVNLNRCIGGGQENEIYHNCFIGNNNGGKQAWQLTEGWENYWYSVTEHEGNYWSDYTGIDANQDGIGDTPYDIPMEEYESDEFPLMNFADADSDSVTDSVDNCPLAYNPDQEDADLNGLGNECDIYVCGDANIDGAANVADAVYLINYVFKSGPAPSPYNAGDANCDGTANVGDVVYLISYIFRSGSPPCCP